MPHSKKLLSPIGRSSCQIQATMQAGRLSLLQQRNHALCPLWSKYLASMMLMSSQQHKKSTHSSVRQLFLWPQIDCNGGNRIAVAFLALPSLPSLSFVHQLRRHPQRELFLLQAMWSLRNGHCYTQRMLMHSSSLEEISNCCSSSTVIHHWQKEDLLKASHTPIRWCS